MSGGQFGHHGALDSLFLSIEHRDEKSTISTKTRPLYTIWLTCLLMQWFRLEHDMGSPGPLIGASDIFELAVAGHDPD
jgi:hypothetical protein